MVKQLRVFLILTALFLLTSSLSAVILNLENKSFIVKHLSRKDVPSLSTYSHLSQKNYLSNLKSISLYELKTNKDLYIHLDGDAAYYYLIHFADLEQLSPVFKYYLLSDNSLLIKARTFYLLGLPYQTKAITDARIQLESQNKKINIAISDSSKQQNKSFSFERKIKINEKTIVLNSETLSKFSLYSFAVLDEFKENESSQNPSLLDINPLTNQTYFSDFLLNHLEGDLYSAANFYEKYKLCNSLFCTGSQMKSFLDKTPLLENISQNWQNLEREDEENCSGEYPPLHYEFCPEFQSNLLEKTNQRELFFQFEKQDFALNMLDISSFGAPYKKEKISLSQAEQFKIKLEPKSFVSIKLISDSPKEFVILEDSFSYTPSRIYISFNPLNKEKTLLLSLPKDKKEKLSFEISYYFSLPDSHYIKTEEPAELIFLESFYPDNNFANKKIILKKLDLDLNPFIFSPEKPQFISFYKNKWPFYNSIIYSYYLYSTDNSFPKQTLFSHAFKKHLLFENKFENLIPFLHPSFFHFPNTKLSFPEKTSVIYQDKESLLKAPKINLFFLGYDNNKKRPVFYAEPDLKANNPLVLNIVPQENINNPDNFYPLNQSIYLKKASISDLISLKSPFEEKFDFDSLSSPLILLASEKGVYFKPSIFCTIKAQGKGTLYLYNNPQSPNKKILDSLNLNGSAEKTYYFSLNQNPAFFHKEKTPIKISLYCKTPKMRFSENFDLLPNSFKGITLPKNQKLSFAESYLKSKNTYFKYKNNIFALFWKRD